MKILVRSAVLLILLVAPLAVGQDTKYSLRTEKGAPPKELKDAIATLLKDESVQVIDPAGQVMAEFWFRKEIPGDAAPEQIKNGLTYRELKETGIVGAVRFGQPWNDYRKSKIKPGVYTLRLGFQPEDGDHAGTAPHGEFCLLCAASKDTKADTMEKKDLIELSMKSIEAAHPGVMLLFPVNKAPAAPKLETRPGNHTLVVTKENVRASGMKGTIGFGFTVVGHSEQ